MLESLFINFAALGTVFGWAFFSFWSAIPAGIALNISPLLVGLTVTLSYASGVLLVVIVGAPLRERIRRRMENSASNTDEDKPPSPNRMVLMVQNAWTRYGLIGLALLAPMTVGAQVGAVIGISFGEKPIRLVIAMTLGAGVWAVLITFAVMTGVMTVSEIT